MRIHSRLYEAKATPLMAAIFLIVTLSSIGLPGTNGFVGEFLILLGTYSSPIPQGRWWGTLSATGVILGAVYMLTLYQKVYLGPAKNDDVKATPDLNAREIATLVPLLVMIVVLGVFPQPFLDLIKQPVNDLVARVTTMSAEGSPRAMPPPSQIRRTPGSGQIPPVIQIPQPSEH